MDNDRHSSAPEQHGRNKPTCYMTQPTPDPARPLDNYKTVKSDLALDKPDPRSSFIHSVAEPKDA